MTDKPAEKPVDLTHEQIKQREHDAHQTVTGQQTPPKQPVKDEPYMKDAGTMHEIPPGTKVGGKDDDDEPTKSKSPPAHASRR
jgi:hypothetical protein